MPYRFTQLKIASGALDVDGNVNVSPKKEVPGRINAQVKAVGSSHHFSKSASEEWRA